MKLQTLRHMFETLQMKNNEMVQSFILSVVEVVNQMRDFGDTIAEHTMATKELRSLTPRFDHIVAAIEESKDLKK